SSASALCENCLQGPAKQLVELETRRTGRANTSNISLLSDVKPVAGKGNGCVSVRVSKVIDATEDRLSVWRSRRCPDHTLVLCVGQDHALVHAQKVSELVGPPPSQWLVDLFGLSDLPWRQARPSCILLTYVRPEAFPVVENLLIEVSPGLSPGTAHWILLEAIDDRLRNGRSICRHVRGKVGIRHVKEQEIYEVDGGSYGRCVNFIGYLVTPGSLWDGKQLWRACRRGRGLRGERTRREENCDRQCYG